VSDIALSSKKLLNDVLKPHTELALDLMKMVKSLNSDDPSHRFQIASIIIFLAGVDKTLSLAFELLYLAGKVDWKWMSPNPISKPPAGFIECTRGLTSKIIKLKYLGVDLTHLQWLADLRNEYVHSCSIYTGYSERIDETEVNIQVKPSGPTISFPLSPMTYIHAQEIQNYANGIVELIGSFVDQTDWYEGWFKIAENVKNLPSNPEPEHTQIMNEPERLFEILSALNDKFVGDGAKLLLK
jgi:hypothetical protein